jgi:serine/threonine protein kinase
VSLLKQMLNVSPEQRYTADEVLNDSWFSTDSRKKKTHQEIRQQFKAKMLAELPTKKKQTIFIAADNSNTSNNN